MPRPIFTLLAELQSTLAELSHALSPLEALTTYFKSGTPAPAKPAAKGSARKKAAPATAAPKPARKARAKGKNTNPNLAFQGVYMAAIRGLSEADKAAVRKVRSEQGVEAAIKLAKSKA